MSATTLASSIKVVGSKGQISLGKQFAGRQVLIEEKASGVWLIRTATVVPDNESWLHEPTAAADLRNAMTWATQNPPSDAALDSALHQLSDGNQ
jgi:hypothetical protein